MSCTAARTGVVFPSTCRKRLCRKFSAAWTTGALCRICCTKRHRAQRATRGVDTIWQVLSTADDRAELRGGVIRLVNALRDHLDARSPEGPAIPHADGRPWWFTPRQFRRTLAWYIANRPFGTVAGKIQYKHASIAMFEGYSGSSPSGFRREIEQER